MAEFRGEMLSAQSKISPVLPRFHCPYRQQTIRMRGNIPLSSWLMLKGRCRDCRTKISKRYSLAELLTTLVLLLASLVQPESGWALAVMILSAWLIVVSVIGLDHQWLPNVFTQGALWAGPITAWAQQNPLMLQNVVTDVLVGFIAFYSLYRIAGVVLRKEALGVGDVLLLAALGSWIGPLSLLSAALVASCYGLIYVVTTRRESTILSFGPCSSLDGIVTIYLQALF